MRKRVLQLIGSFHQGGSERQAVNLSRRLIDDGRYDVLVATLNRNGPLIGEMSSAGVTDIPEFPLNSFYDANFISQVRSLARYLRENSVDLVHTHDFYTNVFGMAAGTLAGTRVRIASKRETGGMRSRAQDFVEGVAFGRADAIVANSLAVRTHLMGRSIDGQKVHVIYNGLDIDRFENADELTVRREMLAEFGIPSSEITEVVTLVANLRHDVKNVPMMLRVASRVTSKLPDVHFVVAGEGELEGQLREMSIDLGVSNNVHFIGRCSDVPALLAASDACVLTSSNEGFSNSILEYMAAGKPVVATDVGGASEAIVDDETGYLVTTDDDASMAERLVDILSDKDLANRLGEAGRVRAVNEFSSDKQLRSTLELYDTLIGIKYPQ